MIDPRPSRELLYTSLTALFTCVLWILIILNRLRELGIRPALSNPQPDVRAEVNWAYRLADAHRNAIEKLAVFAPLAIAVLVLGVRRRAYRYLRGRHCAVTHRCVCDRIRLPGLLGGTCAGLAIVGNNTFRRAR